MAPNLDGKALAEAKRRMSVLEAEARGVVLVFTAEAALKAQKAVREAGRRER